MAKISFLLGLATAIFSLVSFTVGDGEKDVKIDDIFTVQPGSDPGGCAGQTDELEQWLSESIESLHVALAAIDNWANDIRVRRSMSIFFGIGRGLNQETSQEDVRLLIKQNIEYVLNFFNQEIDYKGVLPRVVYPKNQFWLFCDSKFLSMQGRTSTARDYKGNEILDKDKKPVRIQDIAKYANLLKDPEDRPWWAGDHTNLKGYYFTDLGSNYCDGTALGVTARINQLSDDLSDNEMTASIIICPFGFNGSPRPDSYRDANKLLADKTNLADAIPKSATLVHEVFHAIRGDMVLSDDEEIYDIAACQDLANGQSDEAMKNPESYVFFIAHMFHLFGKLDDKDDPKEENPKKPDAPWSIRKNWDFGHVGKGKGRVFGAGKPGPMTSS